MADKKEGREKQARDADNRQRERDMVAAQERADEPEPPVDAADLDKFEQELEELSLPATGSEIVETVGDLTLASDDRVHSIEELVPDTEAETFDSPIAVRERVQRPTVAAAMKTIVEASETLPNAELRDSQLDAYERTLRELRAIDTDDDDEGVQVMTDWITEQISEKEKLPGSRDVRRQAAKFCRENEYEIRNDEWLGV